MFPINPGTILSAGNGAGRGKSSPIHHGGIQIHPIPPNPSWCSALSLGGNLVVDQKEGFYLRWNHTTTLVRRDLEGSSGPAWCGEGMDGRSPVPCIPKTSSSGVSTTSRGTCPVEDGSHSKEFFSCVEVKPFLWHLGAFAPHLLRGVPCEETSSSSW